MPRIIGERWVAATTIARCDSVTRVSDSEPTVVRSVRWPRALMSRLTAEADAQHRTVNNLVIKIVTEALDPSTPMNSSVDSKDEHA